MQRCTLSLWLWMASHRCQDKIYLLAAERPSGSAHCCQQLHLPSGQGMWHPVIELPAHLGHCRLSIRQNFCEPLSFTHSTQALPPGASCTLQSRADSVIHIWHGTSLCLSSDHIVWGLPHSFESFFKLGNMFYLALHPQCLE